MDATRLTFGTIKIESKGHSLTLGISLPFFMAEQLNGQMVPEDWEDIIAEQAPGPGRRLEILRKLDDFMRESGDLVVSWDVETARIWSGLRHSSEVKRKPQALWDSLIDALAVRHGATIASRNVGDFRHAPVLDPWTGKLHRPGR